MRFKPLLIVLTLGLGLLWLPALSEVEGSGGRSASTIAALAPTATINVDTTDDEFNDPGPGAGCSLREAIQAANSDAAYGGCAAGTGDDTIVLPAGTYTLTIAGTNENASARGDLDITDALTITGVGPGQTIINADGIDRVLDIRFGAGTVVITGITLFNGSVNGNGGGIYNDAADLNLIDAVVYSHTATGSWPNGDGGGVYVYEGTATMMNTQIISNTANDNGGGVYVEGTATMMNTQIISNIAKYGGGVYVYEGTATMMNTQIISNTANGSGGGVYVSSGTATMTNTQIVSNTAKYDCGGVYARSDTATITMTNTQIISNTAKFGGGVCVDAGTATMTNTQIINNTTKYGGGGVSVWSGTATVTGANINGNTATSKGGGGGLYLGSSGAITVSESCIINNSDIAVYNSGGGGILTATDNWWGAADGPSGVADGSGDSISSDVTYLPFKTSPAIVCPLCDVVVTKEARSPFANPGDTLTYTIRFSNLGNIVATGVVITDVAPVSVMRDSLNVSSSGASITATGSISYAWDVEDLNLNEWGVITITGVLDDGLPDGYRFTNTAIIATTAMDADASNNVSSVDLIVGEPWEYIYLPLVVRNYTPGG